MIEPTEITLLFLRLINIILITVSSTLFVIGYIKKRGIWIIAPLSWLIHVLCYGTFRFLTPETPQNQIFMQNWTAIVIMHGVILLIVLAYLNISTPNCLKEEDKQ